jgi:phosphate transport system permease protein
MIGAPAARHPFLPGRVELRKRAVERIAYAALFVVTAALVVPLVAVLGYLLAKAGPALSWSFLVENPSHYMREGGLWAPLVGTLDVVALSLAIAAPIGVLAGIYLNEYARDGRATRLITLAVVTLAGVPSIVHGLFGVGMFVLAARFDRSIAAASCTLAIMTLPVIVAGTKEALASVPYAFREACWILGASRWQTIRTVVLPNAISGILTGVILQVSRAAGETAPILFTGAVFFVAVPDSGVGAYVPYGWRDPFMALSYHLFTLQTQVTGVAESIEYGTAVVLVGLVFAVNAVSIAIRARLRSRRKW